MIEGDSQIMPLDIFDSHGIPVNLSGARAFFHFMEFSTRSHIWSKECFPVYDPYGGISNTIYPYTVPVPFTNSDTMGLNGHYVGQLELIDRQGNAKFPFQIEIIITKNAGE
jgi:hypothetical protein